MLRRKGFTLVMEELKQRTTAKAAKVKRYDNKIKQFQDNRNFETKRGRFFKNLEGKVQKSRISGMQNGLTKQKRKCHLKNRIW